MFGWLCLRYSNHPRRIGLIRAMVAAWLWPLTRLVRGRIAFRSYLTPFLRHQRISSPYPVLI